MTDDRAVPGLKDEIEVPRAGLESVKKTEQVADIGEGPGAPRPSRSIAIRPVKPINIWQ
jgi:hypothetical protein